MFASERAAHAWHIHVSSDHALAVMCLHNTVSDRREQIRGQTTLRRPQRATGKQFACALTGHIRDKFMQNRV